MAPLIEQFVLLEVDPARDWGRLRATDPVTAKPVELEELLHSVLPQPGSSLLKISIQVEVLAQVISEPESQPELESQIVPQPQAA